MVNQRNVCDITYKYPQQHQRNEEKKTAQQQLMDSMNQITQLRMTEMTMSALERMTPSPPAQSSYPPYSAPSALHFARSPAQFHPVSQSMAPSQDIVARPISIIEVQSVYEPLILPQ